MKDVYRRAPGGSAQTLKARMVPDARATHTAPIPRTTVFHRMLPAWEWLAS